jgi:hypothetical protein
VSRLLLSIHPPTLSLSPFLRKAVCLLNSAPGSSPVRPLNYASERSDVRELRSILLSVASRDLLSSSPIPDALHLLWLGKAICAWKSIQNLGWVYQSRWSSLLRGDWWPSVGKTLSFRSSPLCSFLTLSEFLLV